MMRNVPDIQHCGHFLVSVPAVMHSLESWFMCVPRKILVLYSMDQSSFGEVPQRVKKITALPSSQAPVIGPCTKSKSSHFDSLTLIFNIILPSVPRSTELSFPMFFPVCASYSMRVACPTYLDLITLIVIQTAWL
jgi:hypothetical protein